MMHLSKTSFYLPLSNFLPSLIKSYIWTDLNSAANDVWRRKFPWKVLHSSGVKYVGPNHLAIRPPSILDSHLSYFVIDIKKFNLNNAHGPAVTAPKIALCEPALWIKWPTQYGPDRVHRHTSGSTITVNGPDFCLGWSWSNMHMGFTGWTRIHIYGPKPLTS